MDELVQLTSPAIAANPWRSCVPTLLDKEAKMLELIDGTRMPLEAIEIQDPLAYPNTLW